MICFLFFCFLLTFKERVRLCRLHIRTDPDPFPYFPSQLNRYRRRKYNELPRCSYQNNFSSFQLFSTPAGRRYRITAVPVWYFHKKWWENKKPDSLTVWQSDCLTSQHTLYTTIWYDSKMCANVSICSVFRPVLSCLIYTETEPISCITPHLDVEMKSSTKTQFFVSVTLPVFNLEWHPHWLHTMGWRGGGRQS